MEIEETDRNIIYQDIYNEMCTNIISYLTDNENDLIYNSEQVNDFIVSNNDNIKLLINTMINDYLHEGEEGLYDLTHREADYVREYIFEAEFMPSVQF